MSNESTDHTSEEKQELMASLQSTLRGLQDRATVNSVYGDPIESDGKTIVPVARIAYGFGGGFGTGSEGDQEAGEGGGAGGGVVAGPVGVLEVTEDETRFIRVNDWKRMGLAAAIGLVVGILLARR